MQNTEELALKSPIELQNSILPKFDFGYWIIVFFSILMLVFIVAQVFGLSQTDVTTLVGNSLKTVVGIAGIIMSYSVTKSLDGNLKHTWKILTWAYIFNTGGDTIWYYYASVLGEKPFPSWADVSFLLHYPVMLWALLSYPTKSGGFDKKKFLADISIVMLSGVTFVWYFIINPTISAITDEDWVSPALNLSYTVGDMILILGILVVFFRGVEDNLKRALQIIVAGVICMLVADLGFAYLTLQGTYFGGHWIENFFIFNSLSHIYAAYYQYRKGLNESEKPAKQTKVSVITTLNWIPYIAVFMGLILLALESRPFWGETLGKVVFSSIGLICLVVFRQIIAVKENIRLTSEQIKHQSEIKFKNLVEHSSDLIAILDLKGFFTYQSPSFKRVLGYENDELISRHSFEFSRSEDIENLKTDFKKIVSDPQSILTREYHFRHKDGSWRILESITKTIVDEKNHITGILFNLRDVTKRRENENKLRAFTAKLERSNRELQDFAYVASHDLQEPLRKVQAFGDRLERKYAETLVEEARDYIRRMRDASARMQTLINDLLTFSRVSTNARPFALINLTKIANEVLSDLEVRIEQKNARIEIGNLPEIEADSLQMRQLLQNLIGNALKFHQTNVSPVVKVYAEGFAETSGGFLIGNEQLHTTSGGFFANGSGEKVCRLIVEDNGIGFEEKYIDRIFTVFQRLHGRTEYEGSGVGLAVCRKIVERHEGSITAESLPDKGAKFIVTLPLKQVEGEIN